MNKKQLSNYYYLSMEIKELENRLRELKNKSVGVSHLTGMPFSGNVSNPTEKRILLQEKLQEKIEAKKEKAMEEMILIVEYISKISDSEVRLIFTKRYIEFKKWDLIAREMSMSERTVFRRHGEYWKRSKNETV